MTPLRSLCPYGCKLMVALRVWRKKIYKNKTGKRNVANENVVMSRFLMFEGSSVKLLPFIFSWN